jgi:hypothetical protein
MAPETGTALLILVAFVLPGFVALLISERTHTIRGDDTPFERLLHALYYSALIYGLLLAAAIVLRWDRDDIEELVQDERSLGRLFLVGVLAVVVLPLAVSQMGRIWRSSDRIRPFVLDTARVSLAHSTPSAWDHFFQSGAVALVRVTLTDGRVVGGYYGSDSFAGYSEQAQDLFLEVRWELDDDSWFAKPAEASIGVWLARTSIASVEFYEPPRD